MSKEKIIKKECKICKKSKPLTDYHKHGSTKDGRRNDCKECRNVPKEDKIKRFFNDKGEKKCSKCKKWLAINNFDKLSTKEKKRNRGGFRKGLASQCQKCNKETKDKYRLNNKDKKKEYTQSVKEKFRTYKKCAKKRGYKFELSLEDFTKLTRNTKCFYCGDKHEIIGVDRVYNDGNYKVGNVVSCCTICNTMKMTLSLDVFTKHCNKIVKTMKKRKINLN